jgi:hypothetical protein
MLHVITDGCLKENMMDVVVKELQSKFLLYILLDSSHQLEEQVIFVL